MQLFEGFENLYSITFWLSVWPILNSRKKHVKTLNCTFSHSSERELHKFVSSKKHPPLSSLIIQCFGSGSFSPDLDRTLSLSPYPDQQKNPDRIRKIRINEKNPKTVSKNCLIILSTLNPFPFLVRILPKSNQKII